MMYSGEHKSSPSPPSLLLRWSDFMYRYTVV
jgi:hypothetical protein